jgi:hypothetical protein
MSIANLSELRTQVASWVNRTDLTTAQLNQFVSAAESDIRNDVEVREGQITVSGSISSGTFSAPTGFLYARVVTVDDHVLNYLAPSAYMQKVDEEYTTGYYTIENETFKVLGGVSYELTYYGTLSALAADADTNWLLENAPNVYLWAACKYASVFLRDTEGAAGFHSLYREAVNRLNAMEMRAKFGGDLVVRPA